MNRWTIMAAIVTLCLAAVAAWAGGGAGDDRNLKALTRKVERLERDVRDLTKTIRTLDKALTATGKEASSVSKAVEALDDRSDERTLLLGKWFDTYHTKSNGQYHRETIRRIK